MVGAYAYVPPTVGLSLLFCVAVVQYTGPVFAYACVFVRLHVPPGCVVGCPIVVCVLHTLLLVPCRRTLAAAAHPYGPEWCALMWPDYLKWLFRKHGSLEPRGEADCTICQRNRDGNIGKSTTFIEMQCCLKKCVSPRRGLGAFLCDGFLTLRGCGI